MKRFSLLLLILISINLNGQIFLDNPSFEDEPADATVPHGWLKCTEDTTPDILPGFWGVYQDASDGETYIGLITRSNGTSEKLGQRINEKLKKDVCYKLSLDLAHSPDYSGYNKSIKLKIWLGKNKCQAEQLIYESDFIKNEEWKLHQFQFLPKEEFDFIIFEAYYKDSKFNRKANILIDNVSPIILCNQA